MLARVQILKAEARSAGEIADAARSSLQDLESVSIGAFGAAQRAQLALLLADALAPPRMEQNPQMARVWCPGQFAKEIEAHDIAAAPASKSSKSRTGMSKATTAHTKGSSRDAATRWAAQQELWQAFLEGRCCPHVQRHAAALLAPACAAAGHLYLAAALLQGSMGATLQLQHRLVLHTRVVQTGKRRGQSHGGNGVEGETDSQALALLEGPWDWDAIEALAGKGRTRAPAECLEALDGQAASALDSWLGALPYGTAVCSLSSAGTSPCGDHVVLTRLQPGRQPLILELPVKSFSEASLANHPIRALNLDPDAPSGAATNSGLPKGAVASVAAEMQRLLERSTQSMKDLKTDTKEQQREWWRARVELDDAVASLVQHLDSEWLGPWRCMLVGAPEGGAGVAEQLDACAARAVRELASALGSVEADNGCSSVVEGLVAVILFGKSGMSPAELRSASAAVCAALGAATTAGNVAYVAKTLAELKLELADIGRGVAPSCTAVTEEQEAPVGVARRVTFQTSPPPQKLVGEKAPASPITGARLRPAFSAAAAESSRRSVRAVSPSDLCGAFDALAVGGGNAEDAGLVAQTPGPTTVRAKKHRSRYASLVIFNRSVDASDAVTTEVSVALKYYGFSEFMLTHTCVFFLPRRLGGMQAATPAAPRTAKRPGGGLAVAFDAPPTVSRTAATAPRPRRPQATPMTTVRTVPAAPRPKPSASGPSGAPVVLVLDATLQALPWESIPGLAQQRLYRLPSLPCAAAALVASQHCTSPTGSADRADAECLNDVALAMPRVDTSSVYYAINPSGDLMDTQATFEDWFRGLAGWEGRAGSPPPTAELATALQSKGLFVYCGHGGAEQYLSSARLRALPRCAPALLMGCSSGRLRKRAGYYEPSGVVLAYLLAGCPAAVANLWDVTDKDIDRYCQAVLTQWLSSGGVEKRDVAAAVGSARMACKLPFLIGAAPVCYGVPTAVAPIEKTKK